MKLFRHINCSKLKCIRIFYIASIVLISSGCEDKKPLPEPIKDVPQQTIPNADPILKGQAQILDLNLSRCAEKYCPQIQIYRLSSNYPEIDQIVDQYILKYVSQVVQSFQIVDKEIEEQPIMQQGLTPITGVQEKLQKDEIQGVEEAKTSEIERNPLAAKVQEDLNKFVQLSDEVKSLGGSSQQTLYIKPQVLNAKGPVVTIVMNSSNYIGGAHGSTTQYYLNFVLENKHTLNLNNIIEQGQRKKFNDLVYQKFQNWVKDLQPDMDLKTYEELWTFKVSENFYLGPKGLILQYGEYEIGPYAAGLPRLEIPYAELQGIVSAQYLPSAVSEAQVSVKAQGN